MGALNDGVGAIGSGDNLREEADPGSWDLKRTSSEGAQGLVGRGRSLSWGRRRGKNIM